MDPLIGSAFLNLAGSGINAIMNGWSTAANYNIARAQIKAQQQANNKNIALMREINNSQIQHSNYINNLMRHDANNAISIKKNDLINAGYSTADPNLSGNSIAQLTNPSQSMAQVEPALSPAIAQQLMSTNNSFANSILDGASKMSGVFLSAAEARSANANASGQEINNSWLDAQNRVNYESTLQSIDVMVQDGLLKKSQAAVAIRQIDVMDSNMRLLEQQITSAMYENKVKPEMLNKTLLKLDEEINNLKSITANFKADTSNKQKQGAILDFEKRIKAVEASFAEMGINFNGQSLVDGLARLAASPNGHLMFDKLLSFIGNSLDTIIGHFLPGTSFKEFSEGVANGAKIVGSRIANGAKRVARVFRNGMSGAVKQRLK